PAGAVRVGDLAAEDRRRAGDVARFDTQGQAGAGKARVDAFLERVERHPVVLGAGVGTQLPATDLPVAPEGHRRADVVAVGTGDRDLVDHRAGQHVLDPALMVVVVAGDGQYAVEVPVAAHVPGAVARQAEAAGIDRALAIGQVGV